MKITVTTIALALYACLAAGAAPPPWSAKHQLPEQASARATPASKTEALVPPVVVPPIVVPPLVPPVIVTIVGGGQSTSTPAQAEAEAAVQAATKTAQVKLAQSITVSVITMTGTQRATRVTRFRPAGRAGDLEIARWSFADRFGRRIGDGNTMCRWVTVARRLCWGEIRLPRGALVLLGSSQTRNLGEFAVIGGTGVYTFKQGLLLFRQLSLTKYAIRVLLA